MYHEGRFLPGGSLCRLTSLREGERERESGRWEEGERVGGGEREGDGRKGGKKHNRGREEGRRREEERRREGKRGREGERERGREGVTPLAVVDVSHAYNHMLKTVCPIRDIHTYMYIHVNQH